MNVKVTEIREETKLNIFLKINTFITSDIKSKTSMKPKRIILIRHGESEGNVSRTVYHEKPDYALELSEEGVVQAVKASVELRAVVKEESVFFYISPFWRTRSTFEHIAKLFDREKISWVD